MLSRDLSGDLAKLGTGQMCVRTQRAGMYPHGHATTTISVTGPSAGLGNRLSSSLFTGSPPWWQSC